jgi:hypothetical protein
MPEEWSELEWHKEIVQEVEALCVMHERITQSSECREFNRRASLLLQMLEDTGSYRLADRAMDLLASCSPKDLSQCDSVQRAKDALERLKDMAKENMSETAAAQPAASYGASEAPPH